MVFDDDLENAEQEAGAKPESRRLFLRRAAALGFAPVVLTLLQACGEDEGAGGGN